MAKNNENKPSRILRTLHCVLKADQIVRMLSLVQEPFVKNETNN